MTFLLSQESTTDATILYAADRIPMEDEACLEGPTMRCTLDEGRALLNPLLTRSLNQLEDVLLGYVIVLVARINEIRKVKASQMPVSLPRAPPGLLPPQPKPTPSEPGAIASLSEAIYSAASNLGTSVPHQNPRTPMCPPDQAETDQAVRVLEGINKAPGTVLDCSEPQSAQ